MSSASDLASVVADDVPEDSRRSIRVLAASADDTLLATVERACASEKHRFMFATDVAQAISTGTTEQPDLAFVDVALEGGAGLALVHHLPVVCGHALVYAIIPPAHVEFGSQAMALGAAGILLAPPSGDGVLLAMAEVRQRRAAEEERARLQSELSAWKRRTELVERVARLADEGDRTKAALAIAEALAEATRASGAAIYSVDGDPPEDRIRLAAVGSAALLADDDRVNPSREGIHTLALTLGGRTVGYALLDNASGLDGDAMRPLLEMASAVLAAGQPQRPSLQTNDGRGSSAWSRIYALDHFKDTASREIDRARRYGRRLVVGVILVSDPRESFIEPILLDALRESDVLAKGSHGEYYLLLPETGAIGAHACRRRMLRLASPKGGNVGETGAKLSIGIATYPHDGHAFESLAERARGRAVEATHSLVHTHPFGATPLAEVIDALLEVPEPANGVWSPRLARVELPSGAHSSLSAVACGEALRGGPATILLAFQEESRTLDAVRVVTDGRGATLHAVEAVRIENCGNAEAVVVVAEHGTWTLCARLEGARTRVVHSADPLLADVVAQKLAKASGMRLG